MKRHWGWIKIPKVSKREACPTHSILLSYINAASYLFHDTQTLFMTYQCKSGGTCTNNTVVLRNQLQMYTAGHVYVFVSTKGSLWCWNTSGPWREKHCWYASHGFLWVFIFIFFYLFFFSVRSLFMDVYSRILWKLLWRENANSNHQVRYTFKHTENKLGWYIGDDLM